MRQAMQEAFGMPHRLPSIPPSLTPSLVEQHRYLDGEAEAMLRYISLWKASGCRPSDLSPALCENPTEKRACRLYHLYEHSLHHSLGVLDLDDLVLVAGDLLVAYPAVLAAYQRRWKHVLVDEFQDTNEAQYILLRTLALGATPTATTGGQQGEGGREGGMCVLCAGDDDQSIFSFRGARAGRAFAAFLADFPGAVAVGLPISYRLPGHIYMVAQEVIARNAAPPLFPPSASFSPPDAGEEEAEGKGEGGRQGGDGHGESILEFYSHQEEQNTAIGAGAAGAAALPLPLPSIPPRDFAPRLAPGVTLAGLQERAGRAEGWAEGGLEGWREGGNGDLVSRVSVQEVWDDEDEARWIARTVKELYLSFGSSSFTWEEQKALFDRSSSAPPSAPPSTPPSSSAYVDPLSSPLSSPLGQSPASLKNDGHKDEDLVDLPAASSSSSLPSSSREEEGKEEEEGDKEGEGKGDAEDTHHLAILVRSGWQLGVLEEALIRQRLPYVVQGGSSLLKTAEARAGMAMLGALLEGGGKRRRKGMRGGEGDGRRWLGHWGIGERGVCGGGRGGRG